MYKNNGDPASPTQKAMCRTGCQSAAWWATLVIGVLAVLSFGWAVAMVGPLEGPIGNAVEGILSGGFIAYLGIRVLQVPMLSQKIIRRK